MEEEEVRGRGRMMKLQMSMNFHDTLKFIASALGKSIKFGVNSVCILVIFALAWHKSFLCFLTFHSCEFRVHPKHVLLCILSQFPKS